MFRGIISNDQQKLEEAEESFKANKYNQSQGIMEYPESTWEYILAFVRDVYSDRPDVSLCWWTESDLSSFLRIASDVWHHRLIILFVQTLSSLCFGPASATKAHEALYTNGPGLLSNLNWGTFFHAIHGYTEKLSLPDNSSMELSPLESNLLISLLRLAGVVVKFSVASRRVLCENQNYAALDSLFNLLNTRLQVDIKAALMNTIASFCAPPNDGFEIATYIWQYIEQSQIVPTMTEVQGDLQSYPVTFKTSETALSNKGLIYDLREIESSLKTYPETTAFLKLLKLLLLSADPIGADSVFDSLGVPNRVGGIRIYLDFVIEEVFMKVDERVFASPSERLHIISLCLEIVCLCLEKFDMGNVLSLLAEQRPESNIGTVMASNISGALRSLGLHPGFDIMCRLLSGSRFGLRIFRILDDFKGPIESEHYAILGIYSTLRIFYFVLESQTSFLGIIAPAFVAAKEALVVHLPSSMSGIDTHLAAQKSTIVRIGSLVNSSHDVLALLGIQVLSMLSKSPIFADVDLSEPTNRTNRMVGIFDSSEEKYQIVQGFSDRLSLDVNENRVQDEVFRGESHASSLSPFDRLLHPVGHCIRLAILDMLIYNVAARSYPSLAHYLLGFPSSYSDRGRKSYLAKNSSFAVIVNLLFQGEKSSQEGSYEVPFFVSHPILAEKCYHLIYLVCSDPLIGNQALRYLRNDCDFFVRQLNWFSPVEDTSSECASAEELTVRLHQCAWLLHTVALELQLASVTGQRSQSQRLLNLLFTTYDSNTRNSASAFEQPLTKTAGILLTFNLSEVPVYPLSLTGSIFNSVNLADFMRNDDRGTEIFDVHTLFLSLSSYVNHLENNGSLMQSGGRENAISAISDVMDYVLSSNKAHQVSSSRFHCLQSWCTLVRVSIKKYFDLLSSELRERRIFELLSSLLQRLGNEGTSLAISSCASQTVLALISRLEKDRLSRSMVEEDVIGTTMDSFNASILQGLLDGIQIPGSTSSMRGNYYSSLITFISFSNPEFSSKQNDRRSLKETANILSKLPNRFWEVICRDASDSERVWQTVAFATLSSLYHILNSGGESSHFQFHPLLNFITKRNFLGYFIRTLSQMDSNLLSIISNNTGEESENIRYVYETMMSFLLRISETKLGSDRLIEYGLLETLTDCRFLDQIPSSDLNLSRLGTLEGKEIYFSITNPAFELIALIISHYSLEYALVSKKVPLYFVKLGCIIFQFASFSHFIDSKNWKRKINDSRPKATEIDHQYTWLGRIEH